MVSKHLKFVSIHYNHHFCQTLLSFYFPVNELYLASNYWIICVNPLLLYKFHKVIFHDNLIKITIIFCNLYFSSVPSSSIWGQRRDDNVFKSHQPQRHLVYHDWDSRTRICTHLALYPHLFNVYSGPCRQYPINIPDLHWSQSSWTDVPFPLYVGPGWYHSIHSDHTKGSCNLLVSSWRHFFC